MGNKRELKYFNIGKSYGGNQRWMLDPWMHIGGCAALTTCDAFIYMALYKGITGLCPCDAGSLTKKQYRKFAMSMKPYLQPRESGIKDLDTYLNGVQLYLDDIGTGNIELLGFDGNETYEAAAERIMKSIDADMPVAYLMLKHQDKRFDFFEWHWFLVIGYEERDEELYIKAATYGSEHWLPLSRLWDTGYEERGGLAVFELSDGDKAASL